MKVKWTNLVTSPSIQRSSQCLNVIGQDIYVFGGELKPREPVSNDILKFSAFSTPHTSGNDNRDHLHSIKTKNNPSSAPTPRVGAASATLGSKIYFFSGRGGVEMKPIEERGALHVFDIQAESWDLIRPASMDVVPDGRSYHAMTSDGEKTLYLHAGCPESGRLKDLWSFHVESREWRKLAEASGPPRGGTSIAWVGGRVWRCGGFDGKAEIGGVIDVYDPQTGKWESRMYEADGKTGPGPRSVGCLLPFRYQDRDGLLTAFGESDPSNLGHQGAGKMLEDVWWYVINERLWQRVESQGTSPVGRGWFAADVLESARGQQAGIVVAGGLNEKNERLGDLWYMETVG